MSAITQCRSCGAEVMWVLTKNDKRMPIDASSANEEERARVLPGAIAHDPKRHISHFATCPESTKWRKSR